MTSIKACVERRKTKHTESFAKLGVCPPLTIKVDSICQDTNPCGSQYSEGLVDYWSHFFTRENGLVRVGTAQDVFVPALKVDVHVTCSR
jgi:hypothetical protein